MTEYNVPEVAPCNYNENYLVYSDGSLYNGNLEKMRSSSTNGSSSPYLFYQIPHPDEKIKTRKKFYIHRLVAEHFLPNPDNLRDVHHKDNNPKNNDVSNLEWMSHKDNCALKVYNPFETIKKNPNAYIYNSGKYKSFHFKGLKNIPPCQRYFKTEEEAKEYRDMYFLTHSEVA